MLFVGCETTGRSAGTNGTELGVASRVSGLGTTTTGEETTATGTGGVVVCWGGAVAIFLLVVAAEPELDEGGEEEEDAMVDSISVHFGDKMGVRGRVDLRSSDSNRKAGLVQTADGAESSGISDVLVVAATESSTSVAI